MKRMLFAVCEVAGYFAASVRALSEHAEVTVWTKLKGNDVEAALEGHVRLLDDTAVPTVDALLTALGGHLPDVFFCGGWADRRCLDLATRLHAAGVRTVLMLDTPWLGTPKQWLNRLVGRVVLRPRFDFAWGAGEPQVGYMRRVGFPENRLRTGVYAADSAKFSALYAPDRDPWPHVFLYIGRYVSVKNMRRMERAFLRALDRMPESDWRLCCIGGGELWEERTQHPRIDHLGYKTPQEIQRFIPQTGCFVLPSVFEPWGVVVQEAAQMGLPLLCSDAVQAATDFLRPGENGFRFDPRNEAVITEAFCAAMLLPDEALRAMGRRSHALGMAYATADWVQRALSFLD